MALTAKQALFVKEYLVDLNATGAAIRAGYSEKTAAIIGHENLRKPNIAEAIKEAQEERSQKVNIDAEWVLKKYIGIIERCEVTEPQTARGALDSVGKHLGMFMDKIKLDVQGQVNHEHEYKIEQTITTDADAADLIRQLYKRQAASTTQ